MTIAVGVASEGVRSPLTRSQVTTVANSVLRGERVRNALLSVTFVSNHEITRLNARHLRRKRVTDVIAFGFKRAGARQPIIGDVYIAPAVAKSSAKENKVSYREELLRLIVHGVLHVLGYDHPDDQSREHSTMWKKQERYVHRLRAKIS